MCRARAPRYALGIVLVGVVQVAIGPGDQGAADHGRFRASHADREQLIEVLKIAFVQGRLTKDELDARVSRTFAARTYGELAALTADLPLGLITAPGKAARTRTRPPVRKVAAGAALIVPAPALVTAAIVTGSDQLGKVAMYVLFTYFMVWVVAGAQLISNWHDSRSRRRGQLPPRPAQGGRTQSGRTRGGGAPGWRAQGGQGLDGRPGSAPGDDLIRWQAANSGIRVRHLPGYGVS